MYQLSFFILWLFCLMAQTTCAAPQTAPGVFWIDGIEEELPSSDLKPLKTMIGDAQVIALGESVHTSAGFYQAKFRLIKFLVQEMGFRSIAFETPRSQAMIATNYVDSGAGTSLVATRSLFSVWQSNEVRNLLAWMRQHNEAHPRDKVVFFGIDAQQPVTDGNAVRAFLQKVMPDDFSYRNELRSCMGYGFDSEQSFFATGIRNQIHKDEVVMTQAQYESCRQGLRRLRFFMTENERAISRASSPSEFLWALIALDGFESSQDSFFSSGRDRALRFSSRDQTLATNLIRMKSLLAPRTKTVVWAHNGHIARGFDKMPKGNLPGKNMGSVLAEYLGSDYFAIGLIGYDVKTNWPTPGGPPSVLPQRANTLPLILHQQGCRYLLLDAAKSFMNRGRLKIETDYQFPVMASDHYDALLYLDYSAPMEYVR